MTHVVTQRCVDCRYTDCCAVCPVDCFWEIESPAMLVIDPDTCIDCTLCIPECPVQAIWSQDELPDVYGEWLDKNKSLFGKGTNIKEKKDALAEAISLAQVQANEQERGLQVKEPSGAGNADEVSGGEIESTPAQTVDAADRIRVSNPLAVPDGLTDTQSRIFDAIANTIYSWRTALAIATQLDLQEDSVRSDLETLINLGHVQQQKTSTEKILYAAAQRTD